MAEPDFSDVPVRWYQRRGAITTRRKPLWVIILLLGAGVLLVKFFADSTPKAY